MTGFGHEGSCSRSPHHTVLTQNSPALRLKHIRATREGVHLRLIQNMLKTRPRKRKPNTEARYRRDALQVGVHVQVSVHVLPLYTNIYMQRSSQLLAPGLSGGGFKDELVQLQRRLEAESCSRVWNLQLVSQTSRMQLKLLNSDSCLHSCRTGPTRPWK